MTSLNPENNRALDSPACIVDGFVIPPHLPAKRPSVPRIFLGSLSPPCTGQSGQGSTRDHQIPNIDGIHGEDPGLPGHRREHP